MKAIKSLVVAAVAVAGMSALAFDVEAARSGGGGGGGARSGGGGGHGGSWGGSRGAAVHGGGGHGGGGGGGWHGGGGHGGHGHYYGHGHYGHGYYYGGYYPYYWWGWPLAWSAAWYWGYPYYYDYYYPRAVYYDPVVNRYPAQYPDGAMEPMPQQGGGGYGPPTTSVAPDPGAPTQGPAYMNYCESAKAYYPKVTSCPEGWKFLPTR